MLDDKLKPLKTFHVAATRWNVFVCGTSVMLHTTFTNAQPTTTTSISSYTTALTGCRCISAVYECAALKYIRL